MIYTCKVHDVKKDPSLASGTRVLVDRMWPRGVAKDDLAYDEWFKDVAPSSELRKWFNHDADRFKEFGQRYRAELDDSDAEELGRLIDLAKDGDLSLLFAAHDREINHAVVLKEWLDEHLN
ncbi:DUF488 domain-containing protein [Corynebacterium confusum]|uniref:DUF488 domain-containing protein n=1 Tax=Corynebacterium confusum TaxID=71254 RepID=UPI0025B44B8E|nr:DUF488 family protein [Corynebacterium confusum]WJY89250.1 hypothetical protein CCONF_03475 [Corynebacterium confusum]